jgi:hypothetical protein
MRAMFQSWAPFIVAVVLGCSSPQLARDGQLVFQERGAHGASVITSNGVEFLDRADIPSPVIRKSVNEPWRPATGFLLPADGIWRRTSKPLPVQGRGLLVVMRSSDIVVPSWGGEILVRLDAMTPAPAFPQAAPTLRPPRKLVIVIDGADPNAAALAGTAIENAGERDRVAVVDSTHGGTIMPLVPGSHQTLLRAAIERILDQNAKPKRKRARDLAHVLSIARGWVTANDGPRQILVITDGSGVAQHRARVASEVGLARAAGVGVMAVGTPDDLDPAELAAFGSDVHAGTAYSEREEAVGAAMPPPGAVVLTDVVLSVSSVPAPARVIEASAATHALGLHEHHLILGDMYVGEARTEVIRVSVPPWVPGEPFELTLAARYHDTASGTEQKAQAMLKCRYSNDVVEIANARNGDVIAYASALAMVRRLHRAFAGSQVDRLGGLRPVATQQARSLRELARVQADPALETQSEILSTLLGVIDD